MTRVDVWLVGTVTKTPYMWWGHECTGFGNGSKGGWEGGGLWEKHAMRIRPCVSWVASNFLAPIQTRYFSPKNSACFIVFECVYFRRRLWFWFLALAYLYKFLQKRPKLEPKSKCLCTFRCVAGGYSAFLEGVGQRAHVSLCGAPTLHHQTLHHHLGKRGVKTWTVNGGGVCGHVGQCAVCLLCAQDRWYDLARCAR